MDVAQMGCRTRKKARKWHFPVSFAFDEKPRGASEATSQGKVSEISERLQSLLLMFWPLLNWVVGRTGVKNFG